MSVQVRARREAASFLASYVGAQGELLVDTTNNRVQVHDGATPGGSPAAKLSEVVTNTRSAVADAAYAALASDRTIAITSLTAARTITLPAASAFPTGTQLLVVDESGACSTGSPITIARAGSDTINGVASVAISTAYGYLAFESNGAGKWTIIDQTAVASAASSSRTAVADANYAASASDRLIGYTSLGAARTVTLPAASAYPTGTRLLVLDESGAASATNTITLARAGSDTINGAASATISTAYGYLAVQSNGASKWTITDQVGASSSTSRTPVADAGYTATPADRLVAFTALTATRTVTLPAAAAFPTGAQLFVVDESGACSASNTITLARNGTDTINGVASVAVATAYGYVALASNGAGKWTLVDQTPAASSAAAAPRGYLSGLALANNASNPNTQLDVAPGVATADDNTISINLSSTLTKTLAAWAVGSGNGGLDTGSAAANTWYHVFLVQRTDTNVVDALLSTSATSPTLPANYTKKRRIGAIKSTATATNIAKFSQNGDEFLWYAVTQDISMSSGFGTTATLYAINVPAGVKVNAMISVNTSTTNNNAYVQSPDQSGAQGTSAQVASSAPLWAAINIRTNTAAQIQAYSQVANASFYEVTSGWIDTRGK